jgi:hypothetical protein
LVDVLSKELTNTNLTNKTNTLAVFFTRSVKPSFASHVANFWRALQAAPDEVAKHADWPVNESDLHPRHCYLVNLKPSLAERVMGDPDYYDAKAAGWWVWRAGRRWIRRGAVSWA